MRIPVSWLKDFVEITLPIEKLAHKLTMAGLEVEEIHFVGEPLPEDGDSAPQTKISGLGWEPDKVVVAAVLEVMPHPNADRLVLCRLDDGEREHIVLTGAPNLYPYIGKGELDVPLKVAYAREGAYIYDGHKPGQELTKLKRTKIRGVESYSMICSEKELGISDEHEGVILLDNDAPVGMPLVEYMGDIILDISIMPNIARDANIIGVAREIAAITGTKLHIPKYKVLAEGAPIQEQISINIEDPHLNPRFTVGLIRNVEIKTSPYWVQRRLRLAGMRPINNIVDVTNYTMLEVGEPLHAFDYDILVKRAGGKPPTIITHAAKQAEKLVTLDGVERVLDEFTVVVCDTKGTLALAGVMGGEESEVNENTKNVLLEAAAWNYINTRRTIVAQNLNSEAAYRFSRGVHPAMAERGLLRGLEYMRQWSGGVVESGIVDNYPLPPEDPSVEITPDDVRRILGISLSVEDIAKILRRLDFQIKGHGSGLLVTAPDHRLDIGADVVGKVDILEEIARIYGYENIPETRMSDELPPQLGNPSLEAEERLRDLLRSLGLQEVVTYRMTSIEREQRLFPPGASVDTSKYAVVANPIAQDRNVLRNHLVSSLLEIVERNARIRQRIALFEIGPEFYEIGAGDFPEEAQKLSIVLTGPRAVPSWQGFDDGAMDFYDMKGILVSVLNNFKVSDFYFQAWESPMFHPGKSAQILIGENQLGVIGELHPHVRQHYELPETPLIVADLILTVLLEAIPKRFEIVPVPAYPPILEDLAVVVEEEILAEQVASVIEQAGGGTLQELTLFDVYRGEQIGAGKKSLAYSITYQSQDRTLTDKQVKKIRDRIIRRLEQELGAKLRS